jgi:hypothetical protein
VAKDSIVKIFDEKLNTYISDKDSYVVDKLSDIEKWNRKMYDRLKDVEGKILTAISTSVEGDLGGIGTPNNLVIIDSVKHHFGLHFNSRYSDPGFEQILDGTSKFFLVANEENKRWDIVPDSTSLDTNITRINITYGTREIDNKYNVFALCDSPKIRFTDLTGGVFLDKCNDVSTVKPQRPWVLGPYVGYGVNFGSAMKDPRFGFSAGVSLAYNVWSFGKARSKK